MWLLITILRLVIPLSIPKWPLWGMILCIFVDSFDYSLLPLNTDQDYATYQTWDKVLDTYFLGFATFASLSWKDIIATRISKAAFMMRLVGVSLFMVTQVRFFLILFPNFLDIFYLFYVMYTKSSHTAILFPTLESIAPVMTAILLPKMSQEIFIHGFQRLPAQFLDSTFNSPHPPVTISFVVIYLLQLLLFLLLPSLILYGKIKEQRVVTNPKISDLPS